MKNFKNSQIILLLIMLLGLLLRTYYVNIAPPLNADEAAIGYNVYSLLKTGKDEHGNPWPIEFQSFNDYKPGGYFYLTLPFVYFMGLTELSIRIPNIILSTLSIYLIYLFSKEIFRETNNDEIPLLSSFLLAISPWHIHFSRGGWEVNAASSFFLMGSIFLLKSKDNPKHLFIASIFYSLSMYTYHSMRLIVPAFLLTISILFFKQIKRSIKYYVAPLLLLIILSLPLSISLLNNNASSRFSGVGIFSDSGPINRAGELRSEHGDLNNPINKLYHNKFVEYGLRLIDNYVRHFSPTFLFIEGDEIQRNKVPFMGQLYLFEIITVIFGITALVYLKANYKLKILLIWLFLSPLASSLTFQSPHALRAQNMVIPITLISALGLSRLITTIRNKLIVPGIFLLLIMIFVIWNVAFYLHNYYIHLPQMYSNASQYGFKEMVSFVSSVSDQYDQIIITSRYDQPYILTLFYQRFDPSTYQGNHSLTPKDQFGFSTVNQYDKYKFEPITPKTFLMYKNALIVGTDDEIPEEYVASKVISFPNGGTAFKIISI